MVSILVQKPQYWHTMRVITRDGFQGSMHSTPTVFSYSDVARFGQIEREGKKAITRQISPGLRQLSFSQTVASLDYQQTIEPIVQRFTNLSAAGVQVRFPNGSGPFEQPCWWTIKDLGVQVNRRAVDNSISNATITWTLEEWVDVTANAIKPRPVPKAPAAPPKPVAAPARTYRVVSGDCLWNIAVRFLGNGARWPEIYNMNRAIIGGNPNLIFPGQVYRIPG
ncbi:endolysin [Arthrobacter phage KBurrousTX]|uniref:Minor tail protein n=1 Tax=Arthrobacter phage KBurrousTX TaxID=2315608 RepID=A0A386K902_9CAUD|nr:endolysin [Arthrobacter phage KBurrousTX]AYD81517.1 minor tail protein [Arthrobacter phage KBurrousTX]